MRLPDTLSIRLAPITLTRPVGVSTQRGQVDLTTENTDLFALATGSARTRKFDLGVEGAAAGLHAPRIDSYDPPLFLLKARQLGASAAGAATAAAGAAAAAAAAADGDTTGGIYSSLSAGAIVGITVGACAGAAAVAWCGFYFLGRRSRS